MRGPWQRGKARAALSPPWVLSWLWMANGKWNQSWRLLRNGCRAVSLGMLYTTQELRFVELCLHIQFVKAGQNLRHKQTHFKRKLELQALFFFVCVCVVYRKYGSNRQQTSASTQTIFFRCRLMLWLCRRAGSNCVSLCHVCVLSYYVFVFFSFFTSV